MNRWASTSQMQCQTRVSGAAEASDKAKDWWISVLNKLSIRSKLAIVVIVPLLALAVIALLGWRLISASTIGSDNYDEIREAGDLVADVLPPPQYVIEPHLLVEEVVGEPDPLRRADLVEEIRAADRAYNLRYEYWPDKLTDEPQTLAQFNAAHESGQAWFDAVEQQLIPLLEAGDLASAVALDDNVLNQLFEQHRRDIQVVVQLAQEQQSALETSALDSTRQNTTLAIIGLLLMTLVSGLVALAIARAIARPVRQLTLAARQAEQDLPALLAAINAAEEPKAPEELKIDSQDELGELAIALNSMQAAAVGLAADQARTRRNVSTMLANLARRNQGLLNRTLSFITRLEENERDPQVLDNLFKLDHLTTRMRRNAESLLVLAGSEAPRSWAQPIEVGDVIRAAMSEIEAFDRVEVSSMDPVLIRGNAVSDVAHLLAELLDNATRFSPPTTTVSIVGKDTETGYLISVVDQGMGMSAEQLAAANREIESIGRFEEGSTMVLGFAVVARLAARNNILVRLSESPFEGVTAQVRLPLELVDRPNAPRIGSPIVDVVEAPVYAPQSATTNGYSPSAASTTTVLDAPAPVSLPSTLPPPTVPLRTYADAEPTMTAPAGRPSTSLPPPDARAVNGGLQRRVPGTNLFESTLPVAGPTPDIERSAEEIRDALSSFQHGFQSAPKPGGETES